ncbi:prepilin-type N-terminal cleavage/methylation domain-containing protein [Candidatus Woesebacteria bacterium]|nr:prepilin-type N-terminal cleavage/methylation domain-containing protein [Candidatus Woesebacteria bacterium]
MKRMQQYRQQQYDRSSKSGFTLIELLVSITIMGILAAIGLSSFNSAQIKARDAKRKSELASIARALELYNTDFGVYPANNSSGAIMGCGTGTSVCTTTFIANSTTYMGTMPKDPKAYQYVYSQQNSGKGFILYALLENNQETTTSYAGTDCDPSASTVVCNYRVTSPGL